MDQSRSRRSRRELVPEYTEHDAKAAGNRIRERRARARPSGPDLEFFPAHIVDADDLAAVTTYLANHHQVADEVIRAELSDRALLVEYQHQQATRHYELQVLGVLDTAHRVEAQPGVFGRFLGLPSRQACWNRRRALTVKYRRYGEQPVTRREQDAGQRVTAWLAGHRRELLSLADLLVDNQAVLLAELPEGDGRNQLAELITLAGSGMTAQLTPGYAASLAYAMFLLRSATPADPVVRSGLTDGARLCKAFDQVRPAAR